MIDMETRLAAVARTWIDEEARTLSAHPDAATWERYGAGELPAEEIETLRDHLVSCRTCRKLVLGGPKAGATIVADAKTASADAEELRAWHELRRRFDEVTPPAMVPPPSSGRRWPSWASSLVAVLSLAIAGWTWHQANQPRLGVVIAEAVPAGGSRGATRGIEEGVGRPLALLVPLAGLSVGTPVRVEILDGAGKVEWRGESPATAEGEYGLEIPASFRRIPGCQVRLSVPAGDAGYTEGSWRVLGTFVVTAPAVPGEGSAP